MTLCTPSADLFPACKSRKIQSVFDGGEISSDGGLLLLRQVDRKLKFTERLVRLLPDQRRRKSCQHSQLTMLRQRIYGLAAGYEDLNDHDALKNDLLFQTAVDQADALASSPTLCRFENRMDRAAAIAINKLLVEVFIESFTEAPEELFLDFDATDTPLHGLQEKRFFHAYYDHYCFLPLYVFCGDQPLISWLRPSNTDPARHSWAFLSLLVKRFRKEWPGVRIIFRADSGFSRWKMLRWMERNQVHYIVGQAKNSRLNEEASSFHQQAETDYLLSGKTARVYGEVRYGASTWDRYRRVLVRTEHSAHGENPRYVVTNLRGSPQRLYDEVYCARGDMENRIKEQMQLFSERASAHDYWTNQFRQLLSTTAYVLLERMRAIGLRGTELARCECRTLRLKFLKIGAVVTRNTRRIRVHLSSNYPRADLFWLIAARLQPG